MEILILNNSKKNMPKISFIFPAYNVHICGFSYM